MVGSDLIKLILTLNLNLETKSKSCVNGISELVRFKFIFKIPGSRLSPTEAARHPFLAPECALGFIISPGYLTQGTTTVQYSTV